MKELTTEEVKRVNSNFLHSVQNGGQTKEASIFNSSIVLKLLREDGFSRKYLKYKSITPMELDTDFQNPDILTKFDPVEDPIRGYLASSVDWMQPTKDLWYNSKFFRIRFHPMVSRKIKMTESQVLGSKYPIREYLEGVIRNDFLAVEDFQFVDNLERMLLQQSILYGSANVVQSTNTKLLLEDVADLAKIMVRRRMGVECLMCNEATYYDFLKHKPVDAGSYVQQDLYNSGIMTPDRRFKSYGGFKWLLTNNADIIPEKVIYAVPPQQMLGRFYQLQIPQTYVKFENHILEIYSRQILGRGIANIDAAAKLIIA